MPSRPEKLGAAIRPATLADTTFSAQVHRRHLPHGLFPLLGPAFVRRWHATFLDAPHGVALIAVSTGEHGDQRTGFLLGAVDHAAQVEHVLRHHRLGLGALGAAALLVRPRLALHFLRTRAPVHLSRLTRGGRPSSRRKGAPRTTSTATERAARPGPVAFVNALAVVPEAREDGAGAALVAEFVELARAAGSREARLTTLVGTGGAERFYEGLGWQRHGVHTTRDGVLLATYRLDLAEPGDGSWALAHTFAQPPEEGERLHDQQAARLHGGGAAAARRTH